MDPAKHRLMINGLVDKPLVFTMEDIKRFPRENRRSTSSNALRTGGMEWRGAQLNGCQFTHGMVHCVMYTGVPLKTFWTRRAEDQRASGSCRGRRCRGDDPLDPHGKGAGRLHGRFAMNGEALRPEQGYPLRIVVPGWEGNMWVKWLRRIEVGDEPWHHREETSKYTDLLESGKARRFTWEMDVQVRHHQPSPQAPITQARATRSLSGLAWSGRGTIERVDVSLDGGRNWRQARLDGPSHDKALHRFYHEFDWDGAPLMLQSRAIDSEGWVQPTKDALRECAGPSRSITTTAFRPGT